MKNKQTKYYKAVDFNEHLARELKNPKFRKYYDEHGKQLEIAYQILQLRRRSGISQARLAEKIGTTQSNIARMEMGQQNFTTETLQKIADAFDRNLKVEFVNK